MKTQAARKHFKTLSAMAKAAGVKPHTAFAWGEYPPYQRQCMLEMATGGKLKAEKLKLPK